MCVSQKKNMLDYITIITDYLPNCQYYSLNDELIFLIPSTCKERKIDLIISFSASSCIKWEIIKKILDNYIEDIQCVICEDFDIITDYMIGCSICGNEICDHCFLKNWIKNDGYIKCPFCRNTIDKQLLLRNICRSRCFFSENNYLYDFLNYKKEFMYSNWSTRKYTSCYTLSYIKNK